jgi:regulatory protein
MHRPIRDLGQPHGSKSSPSLSEVEGLPLRLPFLFYQILFLKNLLSIMAKQKIITKIEAQKKNPRRRSVFIDGKFAFGVDEEVLSKLELRKGENLSEQKIKNILTQKSDNEAKDVALRFLSFRRRTEKEVQDKLQKKGFDDKTIKRTIEKLKGYDLINDLEFATAWVKERLAYKPRGKKLLRQELWKKGIKKEIIDQVINELCQDEDRSALELLKKVKIRYKNLEPQVAKRRMYGYLLRRGFSYETAKNALRLTIPYSTYED